MKKIILAAAIVLTSGMLATSVKSNQVVKVTTTSEKNVTATAD